ncbi:MAG: DNA primase [Deltaproteobacteria bacterium]|nr:DNA primase [Candidatus Anaeroferrophillus wilburensis]MBN2889028.1 DNA primase [Deltaproteobacteria bacterium]
MTSYFFPPEFVDDLRERVDIVEVVADYVSLVKSGSNYKGLCPFHGEKTPSFMVHGGKGIYHCFGCGVGGDAISFIRKMDNLPYPEAILRLALRCGLDVAPYEQHGSGTENAAEQQSLKKQLAVVLERAHIFYRRQLQRSLDGPVGAYLKKRGLTEADADQFALGYAPEGWDNLVKAIKKPADLDIAVQAGLIVKKENGKVFDRFRDRLMFPIRDVAGRVVGFGGRTLADAEPKYLNSPESPLFQKRRLLYDLFHAKRAIGEQGQVFMVEGYMDALSLYARGIHNVVATLGTALSQEHLTLVKRYGNRIAVFFDNDQAGMAAACRALPIFLAAGVFPSMVLLPAGVKDPDQLARDLPSAKLHEALADQVDLFDFYLGEQESKARGKGYAERLAVLEEIVRLIGVIPDQGMAGMTLRTVADRLHLAEEVVLEVLQKLRKQQRKRSSSPGQDQPRAAASQELVIDPEDLILGVLSRFPGHLDRLDGIEQFFERELSSVFLPLLRLADEGEQKLAGIFASHPQHDELLTLYSRLAMMNLPEDEEIALKVLDDCRDKLKMQHFHKQKQAIDRRIAECSDDEALVELLRSKMEVIQRYKK